MTTSSRIFAAVADLLLDTGAWVALLDRREREHHRCVRQLQEFSGRLISTEPILAETLWLMSGLHDGAIRCAEFVDRGAVALAPISPAALSRAVDLMEQYRNVPMDFAEATLVVLGEELSLNSVFTLDQRGFSAYRLRNRRAFQIVPRWVLRAFAIRPLFGWRHPPLPTTQCLYLDTKPYFLHK